MQRQEQNVESQRQMQQIIFKMAQIVETIMLRSRLQQLELPLSSQLALFCVFFSMEMREAVEHVLLIPDDTTLKPDEVLDKIKN